MRECVSCAMAERYAASMAAGPGRAAEARPGAAFLVVCDTAARSVWTDTELPVGVLTAAIGAPLLVGLVLRRRPH